MSKLLERNIQLKALNYLKTHYVNSYSIHPDGIDATDERWTRKGSGGKRADGLICFLKDGKPYTVSLEAKSHKTLGALVSSFDNNKLGIHSLILSVILTFALSSSLAYFTELEWYFIAAIALVSLPTIFLAYVFITDFLDLDNYRIVNVINQLKQYPANEQWIAYSKHTDNLLLSTPFNRKKNNQEILERFCENNKFGLLLVNSKDCVIKKHPKPKNGAFLYHYCKEEEILKKIRVGESTLQT